MLEPATTTGKVRLAEILGALSMFAELADGFGDEKVLRTAVFAARLARHAGADDDHVRDAFFAVLLSYVGCVGFSHEEAHEFGAGDDIGVRRVMAQADPAQRARTLGDIVRGVGAGGPLLERARGVARLLGSPAAIHRHAHSQCETALWFARKIRMTDPVVDALGSICERYDGKGAPAGRAGAEIPLAMRIRHVADVIDLAHARWGADGALAELGRRSGGHFDPALATCARRHWKDLSACLATTSAWDAFLAAEPEPHLLVDDTVELARSFAAVADLKSVHFVGHSLGVADLAARAGREAGLGHDAIGTLTCAAYLHDLGRAAISNRIWDKAGPLTASERERAESHAYFTGKILRRAGPLRAVARMAASAHERADGSGYPRGDAGATLDRASRLLAAADVVRALGEHRPHRAALSAASARDVARAEVQRGRIDGAATEAVLAAAGLAPRAPRTSSAARAMSDREREVLQLLARGKSNREIGTLLAISARTVQNHVAHIYDKIGVYSRAGATLYAVDHGLLGDEPG